MKHALPLTVCSVLLLSLAFPGAELRFAVKEKTSLAKVFDGKVALHSTSIQLKVDGEDVDAPLTKITVHLDQSMHVEQHDRYGALKEGKPATLARTFDKLEGKAAQRFDVPEELAGKGPPDASKTRSSALEGKTVLFTLGESGDYKASFEDDKGDAELLEALEEDMDLRGLLPERAVEEDKSWEIDAKAFHSVLNVPGGDLKLQSEDEHDNDHSLNRQLEENAKGKAKGTYKGVREVDGHKYAVVALEAEIESQGERDNSAKTPGAGTTGMKISFSAEGELLWDGEAGHFRSCKLESKVKLTMTDTRKLEQGGAAHELVRTTEFEGEAGFTATIGG
jgi:hypothetical protein